MTFCGTQVNFWAPSQPWSDLHSLKKIFCGMQVTFWASSQPWRDLHSLRKIFCGMQVIFEHPNYLPGPQVPSLPPFAADFLLDTVRAATLFVRTPTHLLAIHVTSLLPRKPVRHRLCPSQLKPWAHVTGSALPDTGMAVRCHGRPIPLQQMALPFDPCMLLRMPLVDGARRAGDHRGG